MRRALAIGLALLATPTDAAAAEEPRFVAAVAGGALLFSSGWSATSSYAEFAEAARIDAAYEPGPGVALEASLAMRITRRLRLATAFDWTRRNGEATIDAQLPHPFFFDRPRRIEASASGLERTERASHLDLEWLAVEGRVELAVFAGATALRAEADLVERVDYAHEYPYDEVSFRSVATRRVSSDLAFGWNAGASLEWRFSRRLGLALQARYVDARPELTAPGGETVRIDAGGLQTVAALRVRF